MVDTAIGEFNCNKNNGINLNVMPLTTATYYAEYHTLYLERKIMVIQKLSTFIVPQSITSLDVDIQGHREEMLPNVYMELEDMVGGFKQ